LGAHLFVQDSSTKLFDDKVVMLTELGLQRGSTTATSAQRKNVSRRAKNFGLSTSKRRAPWARLGNTQRFFHKLSYSKFMSRSETFNTDTDALYVLFRSEWKQKCHFGSEMHRASSLG
jgi:hypothetical protein